MVKILKAIIYKGYVIFLMAFTVWYGTFMYPLIFGFEGKKGAEETLLEMGEAGTEEERMFVKLIAEQTKTSKTDLGYRVIDQPYSEGRFHHIGFQIQPDQASNCIRCHGNVPHDSSREVRSFLNMHTFYLACETCHVRPNEGEAPYEFRWYDKDTGKEIPNPQSLVTIDDRVRMSLEDYEAKYVSYGDYGAKVAPGRVSGGEFAFLDGAREMEFVLKFLENQHMLGTAQQSQMKTVIHKKVNKKPTECDGCHRMDNPYLPYAQLGFPPRRVEELTSTAVVGMITKYKKFWIPSFLKPGVGQ
ncbi:MAG: hypothetical protein JSW10_03505 [Pseudomonadota bacterium]|nr:MAG: hypothetical protein JSW10_03505 [Pseudomonadota bacterium]